MKRVLAEFPVIVAGSLPGLLSISKITLFLITGRFGSVDLFNLKEKAWGDKAAEARRPNG